MKKLLLFTTLLLLFMPCSVFAATFVSGSSGVDGALNPTVNTELQLPPDGIFNFTTVNIPTGVTLKFTKNAANTPVYILATGDVTIAGAIDVSGGSTSSTTNNEPGAGGPGGFDGGFGGIPGLASGVGGIGLGPGGGGGGTGTYWYSNIYISYGGGGGFGTAGSNYGTYGGSGGPAYGNARLVPLIGGSGGGGSAARTGNLGNGGGGGGGAVLIASSGTIKLSGALTAGGGYGYYTAGGGSGGAIKLISNTITGSAAISAQGGTGAISGGSGRIRIEAFTNLFASATSPGYTFGLPGSVFLANVPSLRIVSIGGTNVPSSPTASYSAPDMALPSTTTNPVNVELSASNIPVGTTVIVSSIAQYGGANTATATLSGSDGSSSATASVNISTDYASVIMAQTTYTLQTAMFHEGEKINRVRVAAAAAGESKAVYITESGKEIPAEILFAGLK